MQTQLYFTINLHINSHFTNKENELSCLAACAYGDLCDVYIK